MSLKEKGWDNFNMDHKQMKQNFFVKFRVVYLSCLGSNCKIFMFNEPEKRLH